MMPNAVLITTATFLISAGMVSAYRYVLLTNLIDGNLEESVRVETGLDCSDLADAQGAIGFQLESKLSPDGKEFFKCSLFQEAHAFMPRKAVESAKKQHFLADPEGYAPWCPSESPAVKQILRFHKCNYGEKLCEGLRRLVSGLTRLRCVQLLQRDECETLGNEDCERDPEPIVNEWSTSTEKTTTAAEGTSSKPEPKRGCPENSHLVANGKNCCPEGWHLDAESMQCCSAGYEYSSVYQKCLVMVTLKAGIASQSEMNAACTSRGGVTISIVNAEQNEEIRTRFLVKNETVIGLQIPEEKEWTKDGFRWVDGLISNYTNWKLSPKEPNNYLKKDERIVYMDAYGHWIDSTLAHAINHIKRITCSNEAIAAGFYEN